MPTIVAVLALLALCLPAGAGLDSSGEEASCVSGHGVPPLDAAAVAWLAERGVEIKALDKLGAEVFGLDLRSTSKDKDDELLQVLQRQMAARGYLVFRGQGVLTGDEQVRASELFGGRQIHSTHGVHPKAPNEHIFRLSNDQEHGILGVGPQW
jgi:taurine dioxygenase